MLIILLLLKVLYEDIHRVEHFLNGIKISFCSSCNLFEWLWEGIDLM